jgi:hypothetical protein
MVGLVRSVPVILTLFGCLVAGATACADDTLEDVRREVRESSSSRPRQRHHDRHRYRVDDDDDDDDDCDHSFFAEFLGEVFGPPLLFTVTAPWWGPHAMLEGDLSNRADFPSAPYAGDYDGFLLIDSAGPERVKSWSSRLTIDYGHNFDDLSRIGTRLIVDTSRRLGFDTEWDQWIEQVPGGYDSLATGDFNAVFRFAQSEKIQFHSGLGFNWLADSHRSDFGFNFTYGVDLFPRDPWIVSSTIDVGTLGASTRFHSRTSVGVIFHGTEFFTGYDYQRFGQADLHGLMAGVRFWY